MKVAGIQIGQFFIGLFACLFIHWHHPGIDDPSSQHQHEEKDQTNIHDDLGKVHNECNDLIDQPERKYNHSDHPLRPLVIPDKFLQLIHRYSLLFPGFLLSSSANGVSYSFGNPAGSAGLTAR